MTVESFRLYDQAAFVLSALAISTMSAANEREQAILEAALKLPPKERASFLDNTCGLDEQLRRRVIAALYAASAKTATAPESGRTGAPPGTIRVTPQQEQPGEKPGDLIGGYRLLEQLGEGGMGSVWIAEQREMIRRKVALKVIKLGMDTRQVIARFEAERQALALMDHPNIAKVLDAGVTNKGRPYFVMELVSGTRITEYCDLHNVPTRQRLQLFVQVCKAIAHAHQKGIIHRDIKPPNILVTLHDNSPAPVIIDFGIAKAIGGQVLTEKTIYTALEEFIGTPAYMSPEQAEMNALRIDARTDVYALGVLLYELLTGLTPFESERLRHLGPEEIRRIIREEEPPRPSTKLTTLHDQERATLARHHQCDAPRLIHAVRGDLDWIVMKCLEKDRTRRYQTAADLAADVERYLDGEPIVARPPSQLYRLGKLVRRHKAPFATALVTLALSAIAIVTAALLSPGLFSHRPLIAEEYVSRAQAFLQHYDTTGAISNALVELKAARRLDSSNAPVWAELGRAYWLLAMHDERDETRQEAFLCSSNALFWNNKNPLGHLIQGLLSGFSRDWAAATNHLWEANRLKRSSDPIVLVSLATVFQAAGDAAHANQCALLARQQAANDWDAYDRLGVYYKSDAADKQHQLAYDCFSRAAQLAPQSPLAHWHLGQILLMRKLPEEGLKELEHSLELRRAPHTLSSIGTYYLTRKSYALAADFFCEASRLHPSKYNYHVDAALALRELPTRLAEATNHFEQALRQTIDAQAANNVQKPLVQAYEGLCQAGLAQTNAARINLEGGLKNAGSEINILRVVRDGFRILGDTNRVREIQQLLRQPRDE